MTRKKSRSGALAPQPCHHSIAMWMAIGPKTTKCMEGLRRRTTGRHSTRRRAYCSSVSLIVSLRSRCIRRSALVGVRSTEDVAADGFLAPSRQSLELSPSYRLAFHILSKEVYVLGMSMCQSGRHHVSHFERASQGLSLAFVIASDCGPFVDGCDIHGSH
jgi:hypothetical protein